jgi:hypothetical protein
MVIKAKGFKVHMASFVFSAITVMNKTIMPKANISIISDPNSNESIVLNHQNAFKLYNDLLYTLFLRASKQLPSIVQE